MIREPTSASNARSLLLLAIQLNMTCRRCLLLMSLAAVSSFPVVRSKLACMSPKAQATTERIAFTEEATKDELYTLRLHTQISKHCQDSLTSFSQSASTPTGCFSFTAYRRCCRCHAHQAQRKMGSFFPAYKRS